MALSSKNEETLAFIESIIHQGMLASVKEVNVTMENVSREANRVLTTTVRVVYGDKK